MICSAAAPERLGCQSARLWTSNLLAMAAVAMIFLALSEGLPARHRRAQNIDSYISNGGYSSNGGCQKKLSTLLNPTSGSYGNIFAAKTKPDGPPVLVTSIDFYTDRTYDVEYEVFTLDGFYDSSALAASRWTKISSGRIAGSGPGRPTHIPEPSFQPVEIGGNGASRSFYVTLSTADIRYRVGDGTTDGQIIYAESDELQMLEGIGVIMYPLPTTNENFRDPRQFLGNIHYRTRTTCALTPADPMPGQTTSADVATRVLYTFSIQHPISLSEEAIIQTIDESIFLGLDTLLETFGTDLNYHKQFNKLEVLKVLSFPIASEITSACTPNSNNVVCTDVATTVSVSHLHSVSTANIRHVLLTHIADLTSFIPYESAYTGKESVQADTIVTLVGVPVRDMAGEEKVLLEKVTLGFLSERIGTYDLTGAEVTDQTIVSNGEISILDGSRHLQVASSSLGTIDVSIRVTGENRSPNGRELASKVSDSIENDMQDFSQDLLLAAQENPVVSKSAYFERIEEVKAVPKEVVASNNFPRNPPTVQGNSDGGRPSLAIIVGAGIGGLLALSIAAFLYTKGLGGRRNTNRTSLSTTETKLSQMSDGFDDNTLYHRNPNIDKNRTIYDGVTETEKHGAKQSSKLRALNSNYREKRYENEKMAKMKRQNEKTSKSISKQKFIYNGAAIPPQEQARKDALFDQKVAYNGGAGNQRKGSRSGRDIGPDNLSVSRQAYTGRTQGRNPI